MLDGLRHLALEVKDLDRAASFYREHLDLATRRETDREVAFAAGETDLVLRRPGGQPRGGLHTHYAVATPPDAYDGWYDRLSEDFDLHEEQFGPVHSLYFYDTEGNCVEIMASDDEADGSGITGLVEVVFEVLDLDRAVSFYTDLGMDVVDRGDDRKRIRLTAGPFDVELWEPHLGLADARGGVHVDAGFETPEPEEVLAAVEDRVRGVEHTDDGVRVVDPDGHQLLFARSQG